MGKYDLLFTDAKVASTHSKLHISLVCRLLQDMQIGDCIVVNYEGKGTWYPAIYKGADLKDRKDYVSVTYDDKPNKILGTRIGTVGLGQRTHKRCPICKDYFQICKTFSEQFGTKKSVNDCESGCHPGHKCNPEDCPCTGQMLFPKRFLPLKGGACYKCSGAGRVPGKIFGKRWTNQCPECNGTGQCPVYGKPNSMNSKS